MMSILRKIQFFRKLAFLVTFGAFLLILNSASVIGDVIRYDNGGRRDPFVPLVGADGKVQEVQLTAKDLNIEGVVFDPNGGSLVLIDGDFYKEGDSIGQASIISIMKDRVILSQSNQEKIIWLRDEVVDKKEPAIPKAPEPAKNVTE